MRDGALGNLGPLHQLRQRPLYLSPQKAHDACWRDCRSSTCPLRLEHLELAKAGGSRRRSQQATGTPPSPPQARSRTPDQQLWGRHHAGSGLHTGLTARGWVPSGLTPLWDVNSLPSLQVVCISTLQVTLHPQILLLAFGTLILTERKTGRRGESSNIPWGPKADGQRLDPTTPQPQTPGHGLLLWRGHSPFENPGSSS